MHQWPRAWLQCQRLKVHRHTESPSARLPEPRTRFHHVHVDSARSLPPPHDHVHILTCENRFSRWPQFMPVPCPTSEKAADAVLACRVSKFGLPTKVTTDRGSHVDRAFSHLIQTLGCQQIRISAYQWRANGLVGRFHWQLKATLWALGQSALKQNFTGALLKRKCSLHRTSLSSVVRSVSPWAESSIEVHELHLRGPWETSGETHANVSR